MSGVDDTHQTRYFAAGSALFAARCPSAILAAAVEEVFVDLPEAQPSAVAADVVVTDAGGGRLNIDIDGVRRCSAQAPDLAMATLVSAVSRLALDAEPEHLHLHCAALSLDGDGVLISAASGTGKTTLAAALSQHGWTYVSDEAIALDATSATAVGFPKPLVIKPGGGEILAEFDAARVELESAEDASWWVVPAGALSAVVAGSVVPKLIVILHRSEDRRTDQPSVITHVDPADAIVGLMSQTMDAERFGPDAVLALARLVARCRCVAMSVGPLGQAMQTLQEQLRMTVDEKVVLELDSQSPSGSDVWRTAPTVRSVSIGERVVVHDSTTGAVAALDEAGSAVWQVVHGKPPTWWSPEMMHAAHTTAFLEDLAAHGLLIPQIAND
ncbi:hypothetical protein N9R50_01850 [bacterium]|nr:hypothetical protein [bacterium]MDB2392825.1 hypothetical protein [Acidimicrobiaceae bacterium]